MCVPHERACSMLGCILVLGTTSYEDSKATMRTSVWVSVGAFVQTQHDIKQSVVQKKH